MANLEHAAATIDSILFNAQKREWQEKQIKDLSRNSFDLARKVFNHSLRSKQSPDAELGINGKRTSLDLQQRTAENSQEPDTYFIFHTGDVDKPEKERKFTLLYTIYPDSATNPEGALKEPKQFEDLNNILSLVHESVLEKAKKEALKKKANQES